VIVESDSTILGPDNSMRHGRCERYFPVHFESRDARPGNVVRVRIDHASPTRTSGTVVARRAEAFA
jgi:tRNA A37 methylthiotransferase MiaB